jgi:hypothetical protein
MLLKTVQPVDMGKDFSFTLGNRYYAGRHYRPGDMIDLKPLVSFSPDLIDIEYQFLGFLAAVDTDDLFQAVLAPAYPGVSPVWDQEQTRWGRVAADLWIIKSRKPERVSTS